MSDYNKKLISLLKNDCSLDFIKKEMSLTNSQLAYQLFLLKYSGYNVQRKYYGNGDITFSLDNQLDMDNSAKIYTKYSENFIRFLVISDLHYFHKDENRKAVDNAFNYCLKNGINIVFICGDLIDCSEQNTISVAEQAEIFSEVYPQVDNIINFCVLGNHDYKPIKVANIDLKSVLENKRLDIVPVGYVDAKICIKNGALFLNHPIADVDSIYSGSKGNFLNLIGHSHTMKVKANNVYIPSLSNVRVSANRNFIFIPQALDCTLSFFSNKTFRNVKIDQIIMDNNPYIVSEFTITLSNKMFVKNDLEVNEYPSDCKIMTKKRMGK